MRKISISCLGIALGFILAGGCGQKTPSRDHIPVLQQRVFQLQEAIKANNRAAIDSLLSVSILSEGLDSDSLLRFVYGPAGEYPFDRLGDYEIFYTKERALIKCYIMDSSACRDRPIRLIYKYEHDMWLLKSFDPGIAIDESSGE